MREEKGRNITQMAKIEIQITPSSSKAVKCRPATKKWPVNSKGKIPKNKLLNGLTYHEYIKSRRWGRRRALYYKTHERKCAACSSPKVTLHHTSYQRLGKELDEDLLALCWDCHKAFHDRHGVQKNMQKNSVRFAEELKTKYETEELISWLKQL